jgi:hypothetical protein
MRGLGGRAGDPGIPAGSAVAHIVECGDRFRHVERLGVGGRHGRQQANVVRDRANSGRHQQSVQPAAYTRLGRSERVVNRQKIEPATFGQLGQRDIVLAGEELARVSCRFGPTGRVIAGRLQRDT